MFFLYRDLCDRFLYLFKLSESFWNRFKWILLDQEYELLEKKKTSKNIYFIVEKLYIQKMFWFSSYSNSVEK